jgi:hypothetical protein
MYFYDTDDGKPIPEWIVIRCYKNYGILGAFGIPMLTFYQWLTLKGWKTSRRKHER